MNKAQIIAQCRRLADDNTLPQNLTTPDAESYLAEACLEASERSLSLHLGRRHCVNVLAGTAAYKVMDDIIFIDSAKITGAHHSLAQVTREQLDESFGAWEARVGNPTNFIIEDNQLTLYPIPVNSGILWLRGSRRTKDLDEIPEHKHGDLCYWILFRYYSKPDSEMLNPQASNDNCGLFETAFGKKRAAIFDSAWKNGGKSYNGRSQF